MVVCYALIFHQMRVSRKRVEGCGALASNLQKREVNFSRMLCFIFVSYVACVLPATLLHLNERSNIWAPSTVPIWGNVVAFALLMTPFATNPLIYVASDRNYRRAYQDCLCRTMRRNSMAEGWTTPTALRSVRHSVVELVHPALAIGASNTHHVINATSNKIGASNLNAITSSNMVNNHTTSSSSV